LTSVWGLAVDVAEAAVLDRAILYDRWSISLRWLTSAYTCMYALERYPACVPEGRRAAAWGPTWLLARFCLRKRRADRSWASHGPRESKAQTLLRRAALCSAVLSRLPDSFLRFCHVRQSEGDKRAEE
jgi:hypothetical protein